MSFLINTPSNFRFNPFGGWCSPLGVYISRNSNISFDPMLRAKGINKGLVDPRFESLTDIALAEGWFKLEYSQRKLINLTKFDETKTAHRRVTFCFCPDEIDNKQLQRLYALADFASGYFEKGRTDLAIEATRFSNVVIDRRFIPHEDENRNEPIEVHRYTRIFRKYRMFRLGIKQELSSNHRVRSL